ncbi:MAG: GNAT family N-acetyltransferase [Peptococcaceae bacterium]|nr:GNAT family N-acetyltransferase [Peptococcaceae bacterium]
MAENPGRYWVADRGGVIGVVGVERVGKAFVLRALAVDRELRKAGIGAALVDRALRQAREDGGGTVYLLTTTADKYLERWGFERIERAQIPEPLLKSSGLEGHCPSTAAGMKLELAGLE